MVFFFFPSLNRLHFPQAYCDYNFYFSLSILSLSLSELRRDHTSHNIAFSRDKYPRAAAATAVPRTPPICNLHWPTQHVEKRKRKNKINPRVPKAIPRSRSVSRSRRLQHWKPTQHPGPRPRCDKKCVKLRVQGVQREGTVKCKHGSGTCMFSFHWEKYICVIV